MLAATCSMKSCTCGTCVNPHQIEQAMNASHSRFNQGANQISGPAGPRLTGVPQVLLHLSRPGGRLPSRAAPLPPPLPSHLPPLALPRLPMVTSARREPGARRTAPRTAIRCPTS